MWNKQSFYDCGRMRGIICKRRISLHIVEDISNNNTAEAFKRFAFSKVTLLLQFVFQECNFESYSNKKFGDKNICAK